MKDNQIKKIGIVAGILLLLIIGYFILRPTEERYFDKITIPPTSVVTNFTNDAYLDTIVHVGLNILEIDTVFIQIRILDSNTVSIDADNEILAGIMSGKGNQYVIVVRKNDSRYENIEKISHELIHLRDYHNKTLILFDNYGAIYGDKEWEDFRTMEYKQRPWEAAAFKEGPKLANKIREKLYSKD
jgi:hypothetical protein